MKLPIAPIYKLLLVNPATIVTGKGSKPPQGENGQSFM